MLILKTRSRIAVADINFVNRKSKKLTALLLLVRALVLSRWMQLVHVRSEVRGISKAAILKAN